MRFRRFIPGGCLLGCAAALLTLGSPVTCAAQDQSFGLGARFSFVRADVSADAGADRFTGGHLRAHVSKRVGIEISLDSRSETNEELTERTRDRPLQGSLLLFPVRSTLSPYVLGGIGWYSHRFERLADRKVTDTETSRKMGYHAGFGGELRLGRHAAAHADYRYTFLRFGSKAIESDTIAGAIARAHASGQSRLAGFLPSYEGSMWTAGLTIYF